MVRLRYHVAESGSSMSESRAHQPRFMALDVGSRLGHYDVTVLIGEGGMGQVYQATDTKFDQGVALTTDVKVSHL